MDHNEELQQALREFGATATRAMEALVEALRPLLEAITEACRKIYEYVHDRYIAAGAIYGDTHEGMLRWLEELATIARLRQEAAYLEQRHQMLAEIRMMRL